MVHTRRAALGWVGRDFVTGSEHVLDRGNSAVLTMRKKKEGVIRAVTQVLRSSHRTWVHPQLENAFGGLAAKPEEEREGQKCMSWKR